MAKQAQILQELEEVRKAHKGKLYPHDVVEYARDPDTALHKRFTWDNTDAARKWRLYQAQEIIRVCVVILPNTDNPVRAYVSLSTDRKPKKGFYRATADVMSSVSMKEIMMSDAKKELNAFAMKYETLQNVTEMKPVFKAIKKLNNKDNTIKKAA